MSMKETLKAIQDARNGIGLSKAYDSIEALFEDLNKPDEETLETFAEAEAMKASPNIGKPYADIDKVFKD